jgi:hypothetical protein
MSKDKREISGMVVLWFEAELDELQSKAGLSSFVNGKSCFGGGDQEVSCTQQRYAMRHFIRPPKGIIRNRN